MTVRSAKPGRSFRASLAWCFVAVLAIVVVPVLVLEVQRPWQQLRAQISQSHALLAGLQSSFAASDIERLNGFVLDMVTALPEHASSVRSSGEPSEWGPTQAFTLLVDQGHLPSEAEIRGVFEANGVSGEGFRYEELADWYRFWEAELDARPGLRELMGRFRQQLRDARLRSGESGFVVADVYLMLDAPASTREFFDHHAMLMIDSLDWWESCHPGEPYDLIETGTLGWRKSFARRLGGQPGFHSNEVFDPDSWYMPRFYTDKWGTFFSTWLAVEHPSDADGVVVTTLNVDFDATSIQRLMLGTGLAILLSAILLAGIVAILVRRLGATLSRPIEALTEGAEAITAGRYDHVVPASNQAEFAGLIRVFNEMTHRVGESVNLKSTLTKLLSEELADQAGKHGLVLGGREVDTTIMFTDFAGFSSLTRKMEAREVVGLLNLYFGELIPIIKRHGGFPDKFIGDAVVAIFGAPVLLPDHAQRAVRCAIELQHCIRGINDDRRSRGEPVFEMRVGLNTGPVIAGAIGCDLKLEYTSIGETTNLANRMEARCRIGQLLMSENTYSRLEGARFEGAVLEETPTPEVIVGYEGAVSTHVGWVSDLDISKNSATTSAADFYTYRTVDRAAKS